MATWIPESASPRPVAAEGAFGLAGIGAAIVREPVALLGLAMVVVYVVVALVVGFLPLRDPLAVSTQRLAGPSPDFPLGTDALGRDLLSRILYGARLSIRVAAQSVAIATVVGGTLGLVSGYLGGLADLAIARVVRGPVLAIKARDFVEAARAIGATGSRVVIRHIVPNLMSTLIVQVSL